jgi:hypothetical protein
LRDEAGKWIIRTRGIPASGATAVVIVPVQGPAVSVPAASQPGSSADAGPPATGPGTSTDSSKFVQVGEWKNGAWAVDESAAIDLPQGSLLLIAKP